jgi:FkbM family methyltransferase
MRVERGMMEDSKNDSPHTSLEAALPSLTFSQANEESGSLFHRQRRPEMRHRGLAHVPELSDEEEKEVEGFCKLFSAVQTPVIIQHPSADLRLSLDPILGPRTCYMITAGNFEEDETHMITQYVRRGDTVLDCGGGAGVTAVLAAKCSQTSTLVIEADSRLIPVIRKQAELNGVSMQVENGCVGPKSSEPTIEFFLDPEMPVMSSLLPANVRGEKRRLKAQVPLIDFDAVLVNYKPSVLHVNIEGGEADLFLSHSQLPHRPRLIIVHIHTPLIGEQRTASIINSLSDQGYRITVLAGWTFAFELRCPLPPPVSSTAHLRPPSPAFPFHNSPAQSPRVRYYRSASPLRPSSPASAGTSSTGSPTSSAPCSPAASPAPLPHILLDGMQLSSQSQSMPLIPIPRLPPIMGTSPSSPSLLNPFIPPSAPS